MIEDAMIQQQLKHVLGSTNFPSLGKKFEGKVRDSYTVGDRRILITTDRVSAFDRVLGNIPFKGQVLNQLAAFWFDKTKDIVSNHIISVPDPNVTIGHECKALPVEAVVRAYLTGTTTTSAWHHYKNGGRNFCGNPLPDGMKKDQKFDRPIFTPSTKAEHGDHDESVSKEEIVTRGILSQELIDQIEEVAMKLFARGQEHAAEQGLILVDTKYEFGLLDGKLILIDEIHTPDSSRYWFASEYDALFTAGEEQKKLDKEYLRLWLAQRGFTGDGQIPHIPDEVKVEAAKRYIHAYELVTGEEFQAVMGDPTERITAHLREEGYDV